MIFHRRLVAVLILASLSPALSQSGQPLIPSSEPPCANQCPVFQEALAACQGDSSVQAQYQTCFCQSAYLAPIKGSSANLCAPQCSETDWTTIENWFNGFCANGGATPISTSSATTLTTTSSSTPTTPATTTSASTTASAASANRGNSNNDDADWTNSSVWFQAHWRWVVMIIVLAVAFTIIGVVGTIWHRRYKRRREYGDSTAPIGPNTTASHPEMSHWAPSQHSVHDFGVQPSTRRGTGGDNVSPVSPTGSMPPNSNSGRNGKGKEPIGGSSRAGSRPQSPPPPVPEIGPIRAPSRRLTKTPVGIAR